MWRLASKLKELERSSGKSSRSPPSGFDTKVIAVVPKIEETHERVKELSKWQIPGLEKAIGSLAKASERLIEALEALKK